MMLVLGGVCGAILDFARISERVCLIVSAVLLLLGAWLVLAAPVNGLSYHPGGIKVLAWLAFLIIGGCFLWVTRPDFAQDDDADAKPAKGKKAKVTRAKSAKSGMSETADGPAGSAKPGPVAVLMTLALGQGIIAHQFGLGQHVVFQSALWIALMVALVSEKAAPQYRAAVWLGVVGALMASAASMMITTPASCVAFAVLLLVVSAGRGATRLGVFVSDDNPAQAVVLRGVIRFGVLALPLIMAALVAYVGAQMAGGGL
jgi:hypothetical protein